MACHPVGLQAQNPPSPYPALWSRVEGFDHDELSQALHRREVARIMVMRGTIHLVTAPPVHGPDRAEAPGRPPAGSRRPCRLRGAEAR